MKIPDISYLGKYPVFENDSECNFCYFIRIESYYFLGVPLVCFTNWMVPSGL